MINRVLVRQRFGGGRLRERNIAYLTLASIKRAT